VFAILIKMDEKIIAFLVLAAFTVLALSVKFLRKAIGLLFVILGAIATLTFFGAIIGIPMILIGGVLLFI